MRFSAFATPPAPVFDPRAVRTLDSADSLPAPAWQAPAPLDVADPPPPDLDQRVRQSGEW